MKKMTVEDITKEQFKTALNNYGVNRLQLYSLTELGEEIGELLGCCISGLEMKELLEKYSKNDGHKIVECAYWHW